MPRELRDRFVVRAVVDAPGRLSVSDTDASWMKILRPQISIDHECPATALPSSAV